ncbi:MAG TPA: MATE family efflux transporter, partial [Verrucomicrobia bacterium]|nr:MATE family efflux transporter [Verrucomicrobiota bacterium]
MGTLKKQLRQLAAPIFMEVALVMLVGFVDTLMLSRYSDNAVAAVGLDNQIIMLVFLVYQFVSTGAG